ncbi:MAG: helix-turn-helix domain-containing protein [Phycisphaerae bacterium]|nr:helix-turn-helix domain-containing protein [Phycisphaerae bacterium]
MGITCPTPEYFSLTCKRKRFLAIPRELPTVEHPSAERCANGYAGRNSRPATRWNSAMSMQTVESLALRPREAAEALGISARTLWKLTAPRGPIPCLRIGRGKRRTVLYPVADLQAWLSRQAEAAKKGDDDNAR